MKINTMNANHESKVHNYTSNPDYDIDNTVPFEVPTIAAKLDLDIDKVRLLTKVPISRILNTILVSMNQVNYGKPMLVKIPEEENPLNITACVTMNRIMYFDADTENLVGYDVASIAIHTVFGSLVLTAELDELETIVDNHVMWDYLDETGTAIDISCYIFDMLSKIEYHPKVDESINRGIMAWLLSHE